MTLAEFLQQLLASAKHTTNGKCSGDKSTVCFVLTQITGDPNLEKQGQVLAGQGWFDLSSDGERLEGDAGLVDINFIMEPPTFSYEAKVSLDVNSGTLTVYPQGGFGGIHANHLQLQYFNGVLYGTATHFGYDPETHSFEFLPGPVYTLAANCCETTS
jgi:hypothetical protein